MDLGLRWTLRDVGTGLLMAGFSFAIYLLGSTLIHLLHFAIYGAWQLAQTAATSSPTLRF